MKIKPINIIPFSLNNIGDFVNRNYPIINPLNPAYEKHWTSEAIRCIDGLWGYDFESGIGGWRWCPNRLYFYANYGVILKEDDYGKTILDAPILRDFEWFLFYGFATCDGFSGFDQDNEYTCYRPIRKIEKGIPLSNSEKYYLEQYRDHLVTKTGEFKKYKEAREYLYQTFKEPLGKAQYLNECMDFMILSSRRIGKSYSVNGGIITYNFVFNDAKSITDYVEEKTSCVTMVGSSVVSKSDELLTKFKVGYDFLRTNVGAYKSGNLFESGAFWRKCEGTLACTDTFTNRVTIKGGGGYMGPGSELQHSNFGTSSAKSSSAVGAALRNLVIEEIGLSKNLESVLFESSATQRRETKFGWTAMIGTGGNMEYIQGCKNIFYNPESYGVLGYPDLFKNTGKNTAAFAPVYYRQTKFVDENGNTDIQKAFEDELQIREEKKKGTSKKYHGYILSFPFVPEEIFMQSSGGMFHVEQLEKRIIELEEGEWEKKAQVGNLIYLDEKNKNCQFIPDLEKKFSPVIKLGDERDLQTENGVVNGGLVIYEHPEELNPDVQYLVLYDPVDKDDVIELESLNAIIVFKFWDLLNPKKVQFNVVAEWFGRFNKLDKNHEMAFKLANYYKTRILVETNKKDFLRYAEMTQRWDYLEDTPNLALTGKLGRSKWSTKGIEVKPGMKPDLETYLYEVLDTITYSKEFIKGDQHSSIDTRMVESIPSIRICEELMHYSRDGNFDAVSALFLLGVYVRELQMRPEHNRNIEDKKKEYDDFKRFFVNKENGLTKKISAFNW